MVFGPGSDYGSGVVLNGEKVRMLPFSLRKRQKTSDSFGDIFAVLFKR